MPTPIRWLVPTDRSPAEERVGQKLHRIGKCNVFLRAIRALLFDDGFQAELAGVYRMPMASPPDCSEFFASGCTLCHQTCTRVGITCGVCALSSLNWRTEVPFDEIRNKYISFDHAGADARSNCASCPTLT